MLLTRNSGRKDTVFLLIDKCFAPFSSLSVFYPTEVTLYCLYRELKNIFLDIGIGWRVGRRFPL